MFNDFVAIYSIKSHTCHISYLLARKTIAQIVVHKEVVQLIRPYLIFGYLSDIALFIRWQQLWRYRSIYHIQ